MDPLAHHLSTMAYNKAWPRHRLLNACEQLTQDEFVARRTSFFPSIKATLNHIVTVDWYYVDAIEHAIRGDAPNTNAKRFFDPEEPFESCASLHAAQREVDRRLIDACAALTEAQLDMPVAVQ